MSIFSFACFSWNFALTLTYLVMHITIVFCRRYSHLYLAFPPFGNCRKNNQYKLTYKIWVNKVLSVGCLRKGLMGVYLQHSRCHVYLLGSAGKIEYWHYVGTVYLGQMTFVLLNEAIVVWFSFVALSSSIVSWISRIFGHQTIFPRNSVLTAQI